MKVGFIGIGHQGAPIARMIRRGGNELYVWDRSAKALAEFDEPGAVVMESAGAVGKEVEILCTCVRTDDDLRDMIGDGAILDALGSGGIFLIHSTVHPNLCRELAALGERKGVAVLDGGVSGSAAGALSGNLPVFVGGARDAFDRALPMMLSYGNPVRYFGPSGRGMEGKLVNNLLAIANFELAAAALDLGAAMGFPRDDLRELILAGSGGSFAMKNLDYLIASKKSYALLLKDILHVNDIAPTADVSPRTHDSIRTLQTVAQEILKRLDRTP